MTNVNTDRLFELIDQMIDWDNERLDRLLKDDEGYHNDEQKRECQNYFRHVNEGYVQALNTVKAIVKMWEKSEDVMNEGEKEND